MMHARRITIGGAGMLVVVITAMAFGDSFEVLPATVDGRAKHTLMNAHLRGRVLAALTRRDQHFDQMIERADADELRAYQRELRENLIDALGAFEGFDREAPLRARRMGRVQKDGYHVEKILFESQPRHHVTAALFLPDRRDHPVPADGYPVVLILSGHSANGKAYALYQKAAALAATNGIAALMLEAIAQGERIEVAELTRATDAHMAMGMGAMLVGRNTATFLVWDAMRAMDYLATRSDIDNDRIGVMGNSGGGTQTALLLAIDERVKAAAPASYITDHRHLLLHVGPSDAEQQYFGQFVFGKDHADFITAAAPTPTLIAANRDDYMPIAGTRATYRNARQFYEAVNPAFSDRIALVESPNEHGWNQPLREASVRWMLRWLAGEDRDIVEPPSLEVLSDAEMRVTPRGQVRLLGGYRSTYDLNVAYEQEVLAPRRKRLWLDEAAALEQVRQVAGVRRLSELPEPEVQGKGTVQREGHRLERMVFTVDEGVYLPALLLVPEGRRADRTLLHVNAQSKAQGVEPGGRLAKLASTGTAVLSIDVRGTGETKQTRQRRFDPYWDGDYADFYIAYMLGASYVGMRAEDVLVAARWLAQWDGLTGDAVDLWAEGEVAVAALHAAALERELFASVHVESSLQAWAPLLAEPMSGHGMNLVHGALKVYDLPDLRKVVLGRGQ